MAEDKVDFEAMGSSAPSVQLRAAALSAKDVKSEIVEIPEWGEGWRAEVRGMTARERGDIHMASDSGQGRIDQSRLTQLIAVRMTYIPGTSERVFRDSDIDELDAKLAGPVAKLAETSLRLSGLIEGDKTKKGWPGAD